MKIGRITSFILGGTLATMLLSNCGRNFIEEQQLSEDTRKYRDSVFMKDQRVFFENSDVKLEVPVETSYWKWKNLNDSLNVVKKLKATQATNLYKAIK